MMEISKEEWFDCYWNEGTKKYVTKEVNDEIIDVDDWYHTRQVVLYFEAMEKFIAVDIYMTSDGVEFEECSEPYEVEPYLITVTQYRKV